MIGEASSEQGHQFYIGPHLFRFEPPDVGYLRYDGDVDGDLAGAMTKVGKVSAEARKRSGQGAKDLNLRGVAVVGASAAIRIVSALVSRAIDLVNGNIDNPTRFFETERDARVWIAQRRELFQR
jgi:hypothetical protein